MFVRFIILVFVALTWSRQAQWLNVIGQSLTKDRRNWKKCFKKLAITRVHMIFTRRSFRQIYILNYFYDTLKTTKIRIHIILKEIKKRKLKCISKSSLLREGKTNIRGVASLVEDKNEVLMWNISISFLTMRNRVFFMFCRNKRWFLILS